MSKVKTEKYIVIKKHTLNHEVGAEIDLTEDKAKALVGKVRLKSAGAVDKAKDTQVEKLKLENKKLGEQNALLEAAIENLEGEIETLKAEALKAKEEAAQAKKVAK